MTYPTGPRVIHTGRGTTTVDLTIDTARFDALALAARPDPEAMRRLSRQVAAAFDSIREAFRPFAEAMAKAARQIGRMMERLREQANDPVRVAGYEATYYVRAGLDHAVTSPDDLVRAVLAGNDSLTGETDFWLLLMSPANRRAVAVAAMRGWAEHRDDSPVEVLAWHRQMGDTTVLLGRAS